MSDAETPAAAAQPPAKPVTRARAKPRPVWIVTKGAGLHQVPSDKAPGAISRGKGRRATPRDLEIAGVGSRPETN